jgi:hypothetical protein
LISDYKLTIFKKIKTVSKCSQVDKEETKIKVNNNSMQIIVCRAKQKVLKTPL